MSVFVLGVFSFGVFDWVLCFRFVLGVVGVCGMFRFVFLVMNNFGIFAVDV